MKLMTKAMARAMNFMVKNFLAKKLLIFLAYDPRSKELTAASSGWAFFLRARFSTASIAANCCEARSFGLSLWKWKTLAQFPV